MWLFSSTQGTILCFFICDYGALQMRLCRPTHVTLLWLFACDYLALHVRLHSPSHVTMLSFACDYVTLHVTYCAVVCADIHVIACCWLHVQALNIAKYTLPKTIQKTLLYMWWSKQWPYCTCHWEQAMHMCMIELPLHLMAYPCTYSTWCTYGDTVYTLISCTSYNLRYPLTIWSNLFCMTLRRSVG